MTDQENLPRQGDVAQQTDAADASETMMAVCRFYDEIKTRRTIRDYSPKPVPRHIIETCIKAAGTAPSGANQQPWYFVAISNPQVKAKIRQAAEAEERKFYAGGAGDQWLQALEPLGTNSHKPHLEDAPWLIVVFSQKSSLSNEGKRQKNYYVTESVGIACGLLLTALHKAGLASLTHTPNPMKFLNELLERPSHEKPLMIIATGHAAKNAPIPETARHKKPLDAILSVIE